MATLAARPALRLSDERRFFGGMAIALVLVSFIGFAPTYYLSNFTSAPKLTPLVHLHGIVFSAWMIFFAVQNALIAVQRVDIHRIAGIVGIGLAIVVTLLGVDVAIVGAQLGAGPPGRNQPVFLINPLTNILAFAIFAGLGIARRKRSQDHKRFMLLATMMLAVTPLARITRMIGIPVPLPIGGMILSDVFLLALAIYDYRTRGRLHPVTLWAGGLLLLSQPLRVFISHTTLWQDFARSLIG
jgi:hypothetical protein